MNVDRAVGRDTDRLAIGLGNVDALVPMVKMNGGIVYIIRSRFT